MKILIVGAGEVGRHLAKSLSEKGHDVIIVDKDSEKCDAITAEADVLAISSDATDPSLYDEVDLSTIDVVVAATDKDEVNLFVSMIARDSGVPRIIARVRSEKVAKLLERIGVEYAITVPYVTAKLIESLIEGKYSVVSIAPTFTGNYYLVSISIAEADSSVGKRLDEIPYPKEGVKIISVFDGEKLLDPDEVAVIRPNYEIIALVRKDKLEEFKQAFR